MNKQIIQAEKKIQKACSLIGATDGGRAWMELALDPFKDLHIRPQGYPDTDCGSSVVQVVKAGTVVASTFGTNTWDCNIFLDCVATNVATVSTNTFQGAASLAGQGATTYNSGGLVIRSAVAGTPLTIANTTANLPLPVQYYTGTETRIVGQAFEVHNTTAPINQQGAVCYYRIPAADVNGGLVTAVQDFGTTACIPVSYLVNTMQEPPNALGSALILPGSVQTEAKDGAYIVSVMSEQTNSAQFIGTSVGNRFSGGASYYPPITATGAAKLMTMPTNCANNPWCISGAYFTGLSPTTVLTINVNWIVERFVTAGASTDIITLASPSSPHDPPVLEMYSEIAKSLPSGVPVRENGLGDWISGIASSMMEWAPAAVRGLGHMLSSKESAGADALLNANNLKAETVMAKLETDAVASHIGKAIASAIKENTPKSYTPNPNVGQWNNRNKPSKADYAAQKAVFNQERLFSLAFSPNQRQRRPQNSPKRNRGQQQKQQSRNGQRHESMFSQGKRAFAPNQTSTWLEKGKGVKNLGRMIG